MIVCSWNIRGLNKPFKQKELKAFLLKNKVSVIGCLETKVKDKKVTKVRRKFEGEWTIYKNYVVTPKGIMWAFWKDYMVDVHVTMANHHMVHCYVKDRGSAFSCELTFIYGYNTNSDRKEMWDQLICLNNNIKDTWLVMGDFNTMLSVNDRLNGNLVHQTEIQDFQNCITDMGLGQLNRKGWQWSWCNK